MVEYGVGDGYGVWSKLNVVPRSSGQVFLAGLEPGRGYRFLLRAEADGAVAQLSGELLTQPIPAWTLARATGNGLFFDWQPLFPRMVWQQCPWAYPVSLAAGINLFLGSSCIDGSGQLAALDGRAFSALSVAERGLDGRGLIGWYQPDEPDEHAPVGGLVQLPPSDQTKRVTFLTVGSHFFSATAPPAQGRAIYTSLIASADMIGFDLYPLQGWCRRDAFQAVYQAQQELAALAAGKPTFQWIEAAPMHQCGGLDPSATTTRAETWLAIAGGARGIGYFPSEWTPTVTQAITDINREITSLSPALLGPSLPVVADRSNPVKVGARRYDGATYIIAVNASLTHASATFSIPDLTGRQALVYGEHRTVPIRNSEITDAFPGLAVHIYLVAPPFP